MHHASAFRSACILSALCIAAFAATAQPTDVTLDQPTSVTAHTMVLTWMSFPDGGSFGEYRLYRSMSSSVTTSDDLIRTSTTLNDTSFSETGLRSATTYYYKVFVVDTGAVLSGGSDSVFATTRPVGYPFSDDMEGSTELNFIASGPWALDTTLPYSGIYSWSESPNGNYAQSVDASLQFHVDLSAATMPVLTFFTRYGTEVNGDYGRVEVSIGTTWKVVAYFSGSQSTWKKIRADLTDFAGNGEVMIRFRFVTNGNATVSNGWYIDDVSVGETPTPTLSYPFTDSFDDSTSRNNWHWGQWDIVTGGRNGSPGQIHDSPVGNYLGSGTYIGYVDNPNSATSMVTAGVIDLSTAVNPLLTFWQRYDTYNHEDGNWYQYDYGRIYISTSSGAPGTWTQIYAIGDEYNVDHLGSWDYVELDLSPYIGSPNVRLFFVMDDMPDLRTGAGDQSGTGDGWYLDDIRIEERPAFVSISAPTNITMHGADLSWTQNTDGDFVRYDVYRSTSASVSSSSTLLVSITDQGTTTYRDDFQALQPNTYYYRIYVVDSSGQTSLGSNVVSAPYSVPTVHAPFSDGAETAASDTMWAWGYPWGRSTEKAHGGTSSWTESPGATYGPNYNTSLSTFVDLGVSTAPTLTFWHRYSFEANADNGYVEVSTDNGTSWTKLLTVTGVDTTWSLQRIDLSDYIGGTIGLRFRVQTNGSVQLDGWSIDDIEIGDAQRVVGYPFTEGFESGFDTWYLESPWGLTTNDPHGGSYAMTESPSGNYVPTVDADLTFHINLTSATLPVLRFWTKYATEANGDFCRVEVRTTGGWTVAGYFSGSSTTWHEVRVDLTQWARNADVQIRFRFQTNGNATIGDGWYIDDIVIDETPTATVAYPLIESFDDPSSADRWHGAQWAVVTGGRSAPGTITDSPIGNYLQSGYIGGYVDDPNSASALVSAGILDLSMAHNPVLTFYQKYDTYNHEDGNWYQYDYCRVYMSADHGLPGSWNQVYYVGDEYNVSNLATWQRVEVDLSSYAGQANVRIMFVMDDMADLRSGAGDQSGAGDGWYIDDIRLEDRVADVVLQQPSNVSLHGATLRWSKNNDINFDRYEIYRATSSGVTTSSTLIATITAQSDTSFADVYQILQPSTYFYKIYTVDTLEVYSFGSNVVEAVYQVPSVGFPFLETVDSTNTESHWAWSAPWGRTTAKAHSGSYSWTDSPGASSPSNANTSLTTFINLSGSASPVMTFWHAYAMEAGADYGYVQVSQDNGATWVTIHRVTGQDTTWNQERIDLSSYTGQTIGLRFRLTTNASNESDGWYIDDIEIKNAAAGQRIVGFPFTDDVESGVRAWFTDSPWGIVSGDAHSGSHYWSDSPVGNYDPNSDNDLLMHIDLSGTQMPLMRFWHRYATQVNADLCRVEVNGGTGWRVAAYYSGSQSVWSEVFVDLTQWAGNNDVRIRFRFTSNSDVTVSGGWEIDDVSFTETLRPTIEYPFAETFDDSSMFERWYFGSWVQQTGGRSFPYSIHDSPNGAYLQSGSSGSYNDDPNAAPYFITAGVFDLSQAVSPVLTFYQKYDTYNHEDGNWLQYDYCRVYISTNYGLPGTWTQVYYVGDEYNVSNLASWIKVELNLSPYIGSSTVRLMFVMDDSRDLRTGAGDQSSAGDGWYIDDIRLGENLVASTVVDSAFLVRPALVSATPGQPTVRVYGRVYEGGVTIGAGQGSGVSAEIGFGPQGSIPTDTTWTWFVATYDGDNGNADVYYAILTAPVIGEYSVASRFSLDGGTSWIYGDLDGNAEGTNGANGYDPDMAGLLVVSGRPQLSMSVDSVVRSLPVEVSQNWTFVIRNEGANAEGSLAFSFKETVDSTTATDLGWLAIHPVKGSIPPGGEQLITVTFDATGLIADTTYSAAFVLTTNDPDNLSVVLLTRLHSLASGSTALTGRVSASGGSVIRSLATVEVIQAGSVISSSLSDGTGNYAFYGLDAGTYDVRYRANGYFPRIERDIDLPAPEINIQLAIVPTVELTDQSANFWGSLSLFDGDPLKVGDVVTAVDPDNVVCGVFTVTTEGEYGFMHVYGDDATTSGVDEGASVNDTLRFFVNEFPAPTSGPDPAVWGGNLTTSHVELNASRQDLVVLDQNWNLASFTAIPANDSLHMVFQSIDGLYTLVSSFDQSSGGARTYDPALQEFSDLWTVDPEHGYWIKMSSPDTLKVQGERLYTDVILPLEQGWNLTSYLPELTLGVETAFASIDGKYSVVSGFDEGAKTFVPGSQFNDLVNLDNGLGYWVKMAEPGMLQYSRRTAAGGAGKVLPNLPQAGRAAPGTVLATPYWSDYYGTLYDGGEAVPAGELVEVYDPQGVKCGETITRRDGVYGFLHVYGDDPLTDNVDEGAEAGDKLTFVVRERVLATGDEPRLTWRGDKVPISLSLDVAATAAKDLEVPRTFALEQNFPNPFNPSTVIRFQVPEEVHVEVAIHDILGRRVAIIVNEVMKPGVYYVPWDARDLSGTSVAAGTYFYRMRAGSFVKTMKLTLMK